VATGITQVNEVNCAPVPPQFKASFVNVTPSDYLIVISYALIGEPPS
jgi:hypothetical protein